MALIDIYLVRK